MARFCASCSCRCFIPFILRAIELGCLKPEKSGIKSSQCCRAGGEKIARAGDPSLFPTLAAPTASAPLGTSAFSLSGRRAQPTAARRGRGRPPFSRSPLPFFPSRYNDWAGTALSRVSLAAAAPAPGEAAGGGSWGEGAQEPGLTAKRRQAGRKDYRTRGRGPGAQLF